ncbi:hypothetical protein Goari_005904, partial [Gossypium aridum]|nr:hypothetical protein [Gossypium aridum]
MEPSSRTRTSSRSTRDLASFPWRTLDPEQTDLNSSSARPRRSGWTESTWCSDRWLKAWMWLKRLRRWGLAVGGLPSLLLLLTVDSF